MNTCLGAFAKLQKVTISFVTSVRTSIRLSVRPSVWNNPPPTEQILMTAYI